MRFIDDKAKTASKVWDQWAKQMVRCWAQEETNRPRFEQIHSELLIMFEEQCSVLPPLRDIGHVVKNRVEDARKSRPTRTSLDTSYLRA